MAEFTPITTQEQFDSMLAERLKREQKKFEGFVSPDEVAKLKSGYEQAATSLNSELAKLKKDAEKHAQEIADRDKKIKGYETDSVKTRIAHEIGLSYEAVSYLQGEDEESIRKSAEGLKALTGKPTAPPFKPERQSGAANNDAALKTLLTSLKGD